MNACMLLSFIVAPNLRGHETSQNNPEIDLIEDQKNVVLLL